MAGLERFTVTFVIPPSKDFECSICLSVLREPYLTTCCGSHFCQLCVDKVKKKNNECPVCREKPVNAVIDKYFRRQLNQLQVYCPRRSVKGSRKGFQETGCDWVGELGSVEEHLSVDQLEGECQYVEVECRLCGQPNLRRMLSKHINNSCPNRSISCQYCGFQSTHENITKQHIYVCPNYPLICPNSCSSTKFKRHELPSHLSTCLEQEVACSFGEMGCKEKMQRKFLQQHLDSNVIQHQMLTCQAFHVQQQQLRETKQELSDTKQELSDMKSKAGQAEYWVNGFQMMAEEVKKNSWPLYLTVMNKLVTSMSQPVAPIIVSLPNILKNNARSSGHSMPFYTHPQGYKMCLSLQLPYQSGSFHSHGPSITVHFCIIKGEFDDSLEWPFETIVTVTLLNNHKDESHEERVYGFTANRYFDDQATASTSQCKSVEESLQSWYFGMQPHASSKKSGIKHVSSKRMIAHKQASIGHNQCNPVESTEFVTFCYNHQNRHFIQSETDFYFKVSF